MDKKTWIIIGVLVAAFASLIFLIPRGSINYNDYDLNKVIPADENSGNLAENIEGDPEAPILIFEYGDYQCTACAPTNPYINKIVEEYDGKVAVVFRTVIMSYHQNGTAAAAAANAAARQGYWKEYKDILYTNQNDWYNSDAETRQQQFETYFMKVTDGRGDQNKFRNDMQSRAVAQKVKFDQGMGDAVGLQWTPYFIIDGELVSQQGMNLEDFAAKLREVIDKKLAEKGINK